MIEQFIPAPSDGGKIDRDRMADAMAEIAPGVDFDAAWAGFLAMRERVDNPRRRIGTDVRRAGPVLFDPCQYLNREPVR
ncbi:hypothetical protein [Bradyrhizobium liaoningense]